MPITFSTQPLSSFMAGVQLVKSYLEDSQEQLLGAQGLSK